MEFLIQYGDNKYLTSKFDITNDIGRAVRFHSLRTANNYISNNLPKELLKYKSKFKVVKVLVLKPGEYQPNIITKEVTKEKENKFRDCYINNNESINTITEDIDKLNSDLNNLIESKDFLLNQLSQIDKRTSKIYHFIELNDIEPDIAVEVVNILKDTLIKRRRIKHCLQLISSIETNKPKTIKDIEYTINDLVKNLY